MIKPHVKTKILDYIDLWQLANDYEMSFFTKMTIWYLRKKISDSKNNGTLLLLMISHFASFRSLSKVITEDHYEFVSNLACRFCELYGITYNKIVNLAGKEYEQRRDEEREDISYLLGYWDPHAEACLARIDIINAAYQLLTQEAERIKAQNELTSSTARTCLLLMQGARQQKSTIYGMPDDVFKDHLFPLIYESDRLQPERQRFFIKNVVGFFKCQREQRESPGYIQQLYSIMGG